MIIKGILGVQTIAYIEGLLAEALGLPVRFQGGRRPKMRLPELSCDATGHGL